MSNDVYNKLIIQCNDVEILNEIKQLIFINDKKKKQIFTMRKFLPLPKQNYNRFGFYYAGNIWRISIWGTDKDADTLEITEKEKTIVISYVTANSTNVTWVGLLCLFIENICSCKGLEESSSIVIKFSYEDPGMDYGGIFIWEPFKEPFHKEYSYEEYANAYHELKMVDLTIGLITGTKSNIECIEVDVKNDYDNTRSLSIDPYGFVG